jgi:hypothetical protein
MPNVKSMPNDKAQNRRSEDTDQSHRRKEPEQGRKAMKVGSDKQRSEVTGQTTEDWRNAGCMLNLRNLRITLKTKFRIEVALWRLESSPQPITFKCEYSKRLVANTYGLRVIFYVLLLWHSISPSNVKIYTRDQTWWNGAERCLGCSVISRLGIDGRIDLFRYRADDFSKAP